MYMALKSCGAMDADKSLFASTVSELDLATEQEMLPNDRILLLPVEAWTMTDVQHWLSFLICTEEQSFATHVGHIFMSNNVDGTALQQMEDIKLLQEMGIKESLQDKLLQYIRDVSHKRMFIHFV